MRINIKYLMSLKNRKAVFHFEILLFYFSILTAKGVLTAKRSDSDPGSDSQIKNIVLLKY